MSDAQVAKYRRADIAAIEREIDEQHDRWVSAIRKIQAECEHDKIAECGGIRICCQCGFEEHYPNAWHSMTCDDPALNKFAAPKGALSKLTSEFALKEYSNIYKFRVST